jgi:hypothetical protein
MSGGVLVKSPHNHDEGQKCLRSYGDAFALEKLFGSRSQDEMIGVINKVNKNSNKIPQSTGKINLLNFAMRAPGFDDRIQEFDPSKMTHDGKKIVTNFDTAKVQYSSSVAVNEAYVFGAQHSKQQPTMFDPPSVIWQSIGPFKRTELCNQCEDEFLSGLPKEKV